jgi:hypothetical protein
MYSNNIWTAYLFNIYVFFLQIYMYLHGVYILCVGLIFFNILY